jgi:acyl-CoA thioester hydrolase
MSEPILTYRGVVYPWHCDHMGHMNVMWYVGKFDEATWHLFSALGMTPTFLKERKRGMAAVEQHLTYQAELRAGDLISIRSRVIEIRDRSLRFEHEMLNEQTQSVAARCSLVGVHIDTESRKSAWFPVEVKERAAQLAIETAQSSKA